jgi:lysophospholipase L1-like esterase
MKKISFKGKWAFLVVIWTVPIVLASLFVFSIYPNYLLRGHHGRLFVQTRRLSDTVLQKILPQKTTVSSSIVLDSKIIEPKDDGGLPQKVNQPLIVTLQPEQVPKSAYFSELRQPILFSPPMIPDPHTNFAPLPGTISGLGSHNRQQFRYPVDLDAKKRNEIRIFITGGSVAWGSAATGTESTIAGFMEKELRKKYPGIEIKVITAAAVGWVSTQERIWIFNRITEFEPDVIISYSGHNDLESYLLKEDLYERYAYEGNYFRHAIQLYDQYNRGETISLLGFDDIGSRFNQADYPRKTLKNVKIINSYLRAMKIKYVYVLQPVAKKKEFLQKREFIWFYDYYNQLGREIARQAESDGFQFIDHSSLFADRPEFLTDFCHPGDRGYQVIASDLVARIKIEPYLLRAAGKTAR